MTVHPLDTIAAVETELEQLARELEPTTFDGNSARVLLRHAVAITRFGEALQIFATQRIDSTGTWATTGHRSIGSFVAATTGTSVGVANKLVETAQQVARSPVVEDAMRAGLLSAPKLAEVGKGVAAAPDKADQLVATALRNGFAGLRDEVKRVIAAANPEELDRQHAKAHTERNVRCWTEGQVGHIKIEGPLDSYGEMKTAIENQARRVFRDAQREGRREPHATHCYDALVRLLTHATPADHQPADPPGADARCGDDPADPPRADARPADEPHADADAQPADPPHAKARPAGRPADPPGAESAAGRSNPATAPRRRRPPRPNVHMHMNVDVEALRRGFVADGEVCEIAGVGPVPVSVARRYLGDAFLTVVIRKGKDIQTIAHIGRHIPTEIRTAFAQQTAECIVKDCANRGYLEHDHDHRYRDGGLTSFQNLQPMCRPHQMVKEKGFTLGPPDPHTGKRTLSPPRNRSPDSN